jgi:hypothetical protein
VLDGLVRPGTIIAKLMLSTALICTIHETNISSPT